MKNSNTSKSARVPAKLKFTALAACVLVPASAFATSDGVVQPDSDSSSLLQSVSIKAFYAHGLENHPAKVRYFGSRSSEILDSEIDLGGLTVEYTKNLTSNIDFVLATSFGVGSCDYEYSGGAYKGDGEISFKSFDAEVGVNFTLPLNENFSIFVGPRVGVNALFADVKWDDNWGTHYKGDDEDFGLLYGIDAGAVISFTEQHALTLGVGYRASKARPENSEVKIEEQSWLRFSVGYQFSF